MGQFKPMVKMTTTEPSVELKLKKGGSVKMKVKEHDGHKMMDGGVPPSMPPRGPMGALPGMSPKKPSMAMRRRAMKAMPAGAAPAGPVGMAGRMMKKGGESKAAEALKEHADKPASKAHKGLKTGGVAMGQGGFKSGGVIGVAASKKGATGYASTKMHEAHRDTKGGSTGSVKMGKPAGYKKGGECYAEGGKVKGMGVEGNVSTTPAGVSNTSTGKVKLGNAGGYKKGGKAEKKAALGGFFNNPNVQNNAKTLIGATKLGPPMDFNSLQEEYNSKMSQNPNVKNPPTFDKYLLSPQGAEVAKQLREQAAAKLAKIPRPVIETKGLGPSMPEKNPLPAGQTPLPPKYVPTSGRVYKKGGSTKKAGGAAKAGGSACYAQGGAVQDNGKAEKMPQGHKKPPTPVSINQLSGTYKKGGSVK
ncbi:MAG: hypothetical protein FGM60_04670 [Candidatus Planktophila sp.]|nr:hypothetical protein [Candidatus Planktophila sp.]